MARNPLGSKPRSPKSSKGKKKVARVMREFKGGKLKSSSGQKVTSRKQGIAIALSEARQAEAGKY